MLTQNRGGRNYKDNSSKCEQSSRREFLKQLGALPVAAMAAEQVTRVSSARAGEARLPRIKFGKYSVSRLICGTNPFNAGSHLSVFVNHQMRQYYTPEQILKTLRRCQDVGINCWQSGGGSYEMYRRFVGQGESGHRRAPAVDGRFPSADSGKHLHAYRRRCVTLYTELATDAVCLHSHRRHRLIREKNLPQST